MCILAAEILMLVGGLYALVAGKVRLTRNMYLEGRRARIAGLFLVAPLPLAFLAGLFIVALISMGALPTSAESAAGIVELLLVLGGLAGAVVSAVATKPKEEPPFEQELQSKEIQDLLHELEEDSTTQEGAEEQRVPTENLEAWAKTHGRKASPFLLLGALSPVFAYEVGVLHSRHPYLSVRNLRFGRRICCGGDNGPLSR